MRFAFRTSFRQATLPFGMLCLFACFVLAGCTRPQGTPTSIQISFAQSLGSNSSLTSGVSVLKHVVLQVSGPNGVSSCVYDTGNGQSTCGGDSSPASNTFTIDVQQGPNLIQAIAVYTDTTDAGMTFYYGDITANVDGSPVTVPVNSIATSAASGRVMGRYLTGTDSGPTGILKLYFVPPNKPRMLVDASEMVNGWMNSLIISGVPLLYAVQDLSAVTATTTTSTSTTSTTLPSTGAMTGETILWGGPVSFESSVFTTSAYLAKGALPPSLRKTSGLNGSSLTEAVDPTVYIWGYFGANAGLVSSKYVCVDTTIAFQNLKVFSDPANYASQPYLTATTAALPTTTALVTTSTPLSNAYLAGGTVSTNTPCLSITAADLFLNKYVVSPALLDGNGNDNAAGFRLPFTMVPLPANAVANVSFTSPRIISGQLLPGASTAGTSVRVYRATSTLHSNDVANCANLPAGYSFDSQTTADANGVFSISTNITQADAAAGTSVILCAGNWGTGQYLDSYLISGGTPVAATNFSANLDFAKIGTNQCHQLSVYLTSATAGQNVYSPIAQAFQITNSGFTSFSQFQFYSDVNCTTTASASSLSIPAGQVMTNVYVKGTYPETGNQYLMFNATTLGNINKTVSFNITTALAANQIILGTTAVPASQCTDIKFPLSDVNGTTAALSSATSFSVVADPSLSVVSSCATPASVSSLNLPLGTFFSSLGIKSATAQNIAISWDTTTNILYVYPTSMTSSLIARGSSGGTVGVTGSLVTGLCEPIQVIRENSSFAPVTTEKLLNFSVTSSNSNVLLYTDNACSGAGGLTVNSSFPSGVGTTYVYVKESALSVSGASDTFQLSLLTSATSGSSTSLNIYKPVISFDSGTVNGTNACSGSTFTLRRGGPENDAIGSKINLTSTTWTNATTSYLGSFTSNSVCTTGSPATNSGTYAGSSLMLYLKNLSGTSNSASVSFTAGTPDQVYLGSTPIAVGLTLAP